MAQNSSDNGTEIEAATWVEGLMAGLVALVFGLVGALVNAVCPVVVSRNPNLHTPCFINIAGHAIVCAIMSIGYFTNGLELVGSSFGFLNLSHVRINCYFMYLTLQTTTLASGVITSFLGVDRCLAILCPHFYRKMGNGLNIVSLTLTVVVALTCAIVAAVTLPDPYQPISCYHFLAAYNPTYTACHTSFVLCCYVISVILYCSILLAVVRKQRMQTLIANTHSQEVKQFLKHQLKTLPIIKFLAIVYGTFGIIPPLLSFLFSIVEGGKYSQRAWYYAHMIKVLLATIDFFVLTVQCTEFRTTMKKMMNGQSIIQVIPIENIAEQRRGGQSSLNRR